MLFLSVYRGFLGCEFLSSKVSLGVCSNWKKKDKVQRLYARLYCDICV